ncbi:MAG: SDR family oxidoreductase [Bacteroidota bacterium]
MEISLKDKIVLLTGASQGIGAAIALQLAEAGATLALHYGRSRREIDKITAQIGGASRSFQADLQDPEGVARLAERVLQHYGRVDVLINNAGVAIAETENMSEGDWLNAWQKTLQINLVASASLCRALIPQMGARGEGRIIHIASRAAFRGDTPEFMAYAASKGGMVALSRSIARGYGKQGVKSFVVAPGFTRTAMAQQFIDEYGEDYAVSDLALSSLTEPEDIAPTVLFLASGHMDHATGCSIDINAGSYVH